MAHDGDGPGIAPENLIGHQCAAIQRAAVTRQRACGRIAEGGLHFVRIRFIIARHHPVWIALEHKQFRGGFRDLGYDLHRARGAADHGHALAGKIKAVPPGAGMPVWPPENIQPFDARKTGRGQPAGRGNNHAVADGFPVRCLHLP